jgi:hypothetical protein
MGRYFAAIGQGRSLVQGQIAINFISEGYLYAVLDNIQSSATSSNPQQNELNQLVAAQSNPGQTVLGVSTPTDPTVQARIQALTASLGASGLDTAKNYSQVFRSGRSQKPHARPKPPAPSRRRSSGSGLSGGWAKAGGDRFRRLER